MKRRSNSKIFARGEPFRRRSDPSKAPPNPIQYAISEILQISSFWTRPSAQKLSAVMLCFSFINANLQICSVLDLSYRCMHGKLWILGVVCLFKWRDALERNRAVRFYDFLELIFFVVIIVLGHSN
ncbi:unnamed protein product, partial [Vitis vinifera]